MRSTRQSLIDAARKLFGQVGVTNTTMHDIAMESQKGRRTLYTYFKNKNEVLDAVIEEELNYVISSLKAVLYMDLKPLDKFTTFIVTRMNVVKTAVQRNGSLQAEFFRDVMRVELARRKFEKIEIKYLETLLEEGVEKGVFDIPNIKQTAIFIHFVMRGLDVPYIRGMFDEFVLEENMAAQKRLYMIIRGVLKDNEE